MRRRSCRRMTKKYSSWKRTVGTTKKSMAAMSAHVLRDSCLSHDVAEQCQLGMDSRRSPSYVLTAHAPDQSTDLCVDFRTAGLASRFPSPVELKTVAVPANNCLGLDDHETGSQVCPEPRQPNPEDPVTPPKSRAFHRTLEDAELVAKSQYIRGKRCTSEEERAEQNDDNTHDAHAIISIWLL